ncbi:MAG TPA: isochorismatase family protein [Alcaligenes faecalis]|nr:isochorismatase family protein [Alcaligenes faecalis]
MNIHLLAIDPQNDFCDTPERNLPRDVNGHVIARPTLSVAGATGDLSRLGSFIQEMGSRLSNLTVTLDSHPFVAIERPTFWQNAEDQHNLVSPFTQISLADVKSGKYVPRFEMDTVLMQLERLEAKGEKLMVWPVHCVTGTWGHMLNESVASAVHGWEFLTGRPAQMVSKGACPWTEHYGIFVAETPLPEWDNTQFNFTLANHISAADKLVVAGEAASHCVRASVMQLVEAADDGLIDFDPAKVVLLTDCMSPVAGFEQQVSDFFEYMQSRGASCMGWADAVESL